MSREAIGIVEFEMKRVRITLIGLAAVVVVASCGGNASKPPTLNEWASSVCARLAPYEKAMLARSVRVSHLRPPPNVAGSAIYAEFIGAKRLTMQLVADLKALDLPDTESKAAAKLRDEAIGFVARGIPNDGRVLEKVLTELSRDPTAAHVSRILDGLELWMVNQAIRAARDVVSLVPLVGSMELQQAFADSDECDKLAAEGK